jgi:ABC-type multidrug transport system fused ATPase/permease subunit
MNIIKKIFKFLDPSLKLSALLLIILVILNAFAETLSIAMIIPIMIFLFENSFIESYPKIFSIIELFSPFKYLGGEYAEKILVISGLLMIFCFLIIIRIIFNLLFLYYKAALELKTRYLLTKKLINGYFNFANNNFFNKNNSSLAFSAISETQHVSACIGLLFVLISEFFLLMGIFIILMIYQTKITIILSIVIGISSIVFLIFFKRKINLFSVKRREGEEENMQQVNEMFDGLMEIKSYKATDYFMKKYSINFKNYLENLKFSSILSSLPKLWLEFVALFLITLLLSYMLKNNFSQSMIISTLGLYVAAVFRLMPSINKIINAIQMIKYFEPVLDNILKDVDVLNKNILIEEKDIQKIKMDSKIILSNLSYGYNESDLLLENLSLTITKNQKIGITGRSGCGKSTLVKILAGLIKPTKGKFIIDERINIEDDYLNLQNISFVPQDVFIMSDSIRKNIGFGIEQEDIDDDKIKYCIKKVQLEDLINSHKDGINHKLLENGKNLSGGQIQRIGIARALYYEPDIIVFDESTNSLDLINEEKILKLIHEISANKTVIFVSHRKEVLNFCDIIYRMENKKIYV